MKSIDLVMWTLNSQKTLSVVLSSIKIAIPDKCVNQKIIVDGNSEDNTREIGESFGWNVINTKDRGIGKQANIALDIVETEIFASFEHDIILNPLWLCSIRGQIEKPNVAVVQGVRVATNSVMRAIEKYSLKRDLRYSSIDNNLYRTKIIREIGGYNPNYPVSTDRELQDRVWEAGYKWIVDRTIISDHIKPSFRDSATNVHKLTLLKDYPKDNSTIENLAKLLFSPIRGMEIVYDQKCPQAFLAYPYWRFWRMKTVIQLKGKRRRRNND